MSGVDPTDSAGVPWPAVSRDAEDFLESWPTALTKTQINMEEFYFSLCNNLNISIPRLLWQL